MRTNLKTKEFYSQFIKKGDLCFDIGANIGKITENLLNIGAKVISVEPQKSCLIKLYDLYGNNRNLIIVNKAVGAKEGYEEFYICDDFDSMSTFSEEFRIKSRYSKDYSWRKKEIVVVTTLDNLIQLYGLPKFCKIDVEGYEVEVFNGLSTRIPFISFEFHIELIDKAKKCIDRLLLLGPVKFNFAIGDKKELFLKKWVSPDILFKALNSLDDDLLWGDLYARFI